VSTSNADASTGITATGGVNVITKSGSTISTAAHSRMSQLGFFGQAEFRCDQTGL